MGTDPFGHQRVAAAATGRPHPLPRLQIVIEFENPRPTIVADWAGETDGGRMLDFLEHGDPRLLGLVADAQAIREQAA